MQILYIYIAEFCYVKMKCKKYNYISLNSNIFLLNYTKKIILIN